MVAWKEKEEASKKDIVRIREKTVLFLDHSGEPEIV
jgi:hypothetical protein